MSRVLVLNAGSATLKFGLYEAADCRLRGEVERIGDAPALRLVSGDLDTDGFAPADSGHAGVAEALLDWLGSDLDLEGLAGVGHRVVHGGTRLAEPVRLDADRLAYLESLEPLAPLHQPQSLAIIRDLMARHPSLPQVACFDTAFHRTQPRVRQLFALPRHLADEGVLRYGFHGLSYAHVTRQLPAVVGEAAARGRVVVAHLGQGCSLCALENGRSVATSMGFTALDGMMMGSRCGRLDPGVVLYLQQQRGMSVAEVERLLYRESGLLGVSGISADMRDLLASPSPHAEEAVALFVDRLLEEIGASVALLGGLDALVFTGGIGEHAAEIRARTLNALGWLGIHLDAPANARHALRIDGKKGPAVAVVPTDEEGEMARGTLACLDTR
ncbi:acetate/propionate family kinase [Halomonas rhizosphaerae]|uniref:Acetate kinase n=1 Tax=Halomonas rhizosphaerae TaxID=3043296 RepID=A0ABT6V1H6_9GAMM|nr:acetate/propionate family kinase [Halomonas rhizosphaerae]MDI5892080.1 acetate/propionate family kinase [Halomonas rhizosphaerae]